MSSHSSVRHTRPRFSGMSVDRFVRGIINYGTLPFRSRFDQNIFWIIRTIDDGSLEQLRHFEEMTESAWKGLERIGYDIVRRFKPKVIVELGTHMGLSALAMGQGLAANQEDGQLFAIDTWQGEEHAGTYDDTVYQTFMKRRDELGLSKTIVPLRMLFDEALDKIKTPIDLLHIDGFHTAEAVRHDFETYGPLVRSGGLVLFHDVNSQWKGVVDYWASLQRKYPTTHTIEHSNGLGILQIP